MWDIFKGLLLGSDNRVPGEIPWASVPFQDQQIIAPVTIDQSTADNITIIRLVNIRRAVI